MEAMEGVPIWSICTPGCQGETGVLSAMCVHMPHLPSEWHVATLHRAYTLNVPYHEEGREPTPACSLQDIVRQVEQGSAKVLQAVDWPQSGPDNGKGQVLEDQRRDSGDSTEPEATGQVTGTCSLSGELKCEVIMVPLSV